ncbi:MAG: O-antigen ligase family protein [Deltaproteobacteria bacterium]|nr:O-antigen ligase family protein [Deltaproteobacteria bacterium]
MISSERIGRVRAFATIAFAACLPISTSGAQAALAVLIALWVVDFARRRARPLDAQGLAIIVWIAWLLVCALASDMPGHSLAKWTRWWIHLAWFALVPALEDRRVFTRSIVALGISTALIGIYAAAQWRFGDAVPRILTPPVKLWQEHGGHNLAVGLFDHHLTFGNTMYLCVALLAAAALLPGMRTRAGLALAAALGAVGLVASYARSAWIAAALGAAIFAYRRGKRVFIAVCVAGLVAVVALSAASETIRDRLASTMRAGSNLERIYIWKTSLDMAFDHPVAGVGPGVYRQVVDDYRRDYNIKWTTKAHAHNSYFMAASEGGVVGAAIFAWVAGAGLWLAWRRQRGEPDSMTPFAVAGFATLAGFAAGSFFQHNFGDAEVMCAYWFCCAAIANARDWMAPERKESA